MVPPDRAEEARALIAERMKDAERNLSENADGMSLLPAGSRLGRFQIASVLGQGAMGVVYLANDPEIGRDVAIKTVRPESVGGETPQEIEARFLREAKLAGRLQHPNIVTIYDVGREGGVCFIAMEHVDGQPLTRYSRRRTTRCPSPRRSASSARSPRRSATPTSAACSTATSSPATSSSAATAA